MGLELDTTSFTLPEKTTPVEPKAIDNFTLTFTPTTETTPVLDTSIPSTTTSSDGNILNISFNDGETYDLDDIIESKTRLNPTSLIAQIQTSEYDDEVKETIFKFAAIDVLLDNGIADVTYDNYKDKVSELPNFLLLFETYVSKYYEIYEEEALNSGLSGSLLLGSVIEKIHISHADYVKYLQSLQDNVYSTDYSSGFPSIHPQVTWEDGTLEPLQSGSTAEVTQGILDDLDDRITDIEKIVGIGEDIDTNYDEYQEIVAAVKALQATTTNLQNTNEVLWTDLTGDYGWLYSSDFKPIYTGDNKQIYLLESEDA